MVECAAGRGARGREGEYEGVGELALSSWGARVICGCHAALRETRVEETRTWRTR